MNDVFIIEDCFDSILLNEFDYITHMQSFPWYSGYDISYEFFKSEKLKSCVIKSKNAVQSFCFQHFVILSNIPKDKINSTSDKFSKDVFWSVIEKHGLWKKEDITIDRLKFNLQTQNTFQQSPELHNIPHVDQPFPENNSWVMIVYLNSSDGDTVLFNERFDNTIKTETTERMRVTPVKGKSLIFKGDIFHASSNPIMNNQRIVMNVNFSINEL